MHFKSIPEYFADLFLAKGKWNTFSATFILCSAPKMIQSQNVNSVIYKRRKSRRFVTKLQSFPFNYSSDFLILLKACEIFAVNCHVLRWFMRGNLIVFCFSVFHRMLVRYSALLTNILVISTLFITSTPEKFSFVRPATFLFAHSTVTSHHLSKSSLCQLSR